PHAILLNGPRGIGKATLVFRLARFLLAERDRPTDAAGQGLATDLECGVFHRVAAGGHADLLTVERAYDPRRRRLRGEIVVEDAREITAFFRLTAAEGGWRIVVVDGAEEMNRNAANALLKILEDPLALPALATRRAGPADRDAAARSVPSRARRARSRAAGGTSRREHWTRTGARRCQRARALPVDGRNAVTGSGYRCCTAACLRRSARPC